MFSVNLLADSLAKNPSWKNDLIFRHKKASSNDSSDVESNSSSSRSGQKLHGRIGNKLHVQLPSGNTTVIPYESNLKISDLMERVCMKEKLDSSDFFIMLMVDDNNHHGLLDYTIPKEKAVLELFQYSSIKLCAKFVFDVTLSDPADYEHGAFGECSFFHVRKIFSCL